MDLAPSLEGNWARRASIVLFPVIKTASSETKTLEPRVLATFSIF
jgi:hypothetical protein